MINILAHHNIVNTDLFNLVDQQYYLVLTMSNITNHHLSQYVCNLYTFTQILLVHGKNQNKTKE